MQFVVVRLGKDSVLDIKKLNDPNPLSSVPFKFTFYCTQVEEGISVGDYVLIWLGSNNNKGQPTAWKQGLRGIGRIADLDRAPKFNQTSKIIIEVLSVFPQSIDRIDFLDKSATYYKYFSKYPVVGVGYSRNNSIQKVNEESRQNTSALLTSIGILYPEIAENLKESTPDLRGFFDFSPVGDHAPTLDTFGEEESNIAEDDSVWTWVSNEIFQKEERNILFLGAPGTGKTWYAHEIAKKITNNDPKKHAFIQFHPSFSYDDFVEGYSPSLDAASSSIQYRLEEKHFLKLCEAARSDGSNLYVMVIDELTRGDPSRIFGEFLTYLEKGHRNRQFSLAYSGKQISLPDNVVVIATANPFDRSVGELDDALVRRFVMREFLPSEEALKRHLEQSKVDTNFANRLLHVFKVINAQHPVGFGHSHFWNVRSEEDFQTLRSSRIRFLLSRAFSYDQDGLLALNADISDVFPETDSQNIAEHSLVEPSTQGYTSEQED
jgi:hypothetical protein